MANKDRPSFDKFKKEAFKQNSFVEEYEKLKPEFDLASQLIIARKKAKISQSEIAAKLHTKQPAIARFENGGFTKSSISKLQEYAGALGYELHIGLIPKGHDHHIN